MIVECDDISDALSLKLPHTKDYIVFEWRGGKGLVYFSACQMGKSMAIHIAASHENKRYLRKAVEEFCRYIFDRYQWCRMITGVIEKKSVLNLSLKCGFGIVAGNEEATVVARVR